MKQWLLTGVVASLCLTGCMNLAPAPEALPNSVPQAWPENTVATVASLPSWQEVIVNPKLREVVDLALKHSFTLKNETLTVKRLEAQYRIARANLLPQVAASGNYTRNRVPATMSPLGQPVLQKTATADVGLSYELDFFGRVRNLNEAALQQYLATKEGRDLAQGVLISQVVGAWLQTVSSRDALAKQTQILKNQEDLLKMVEAQVKWGTAEPLALSQAQAQYQGIKAQWESMKAQAQVAQLNLNEVVGTDVPADLIDEAWSSSPYVNVSMLSGSVSDVLLARPDIRQAEHQLAAARANVGAARALYFPQISLMGSVGTMAPEFSDLFTGPGFTWRVMPSIQWSIFNMGATQAQVEVAKVNQEAALVGYEAALRHAFTETAQSLVNVQSANAALAAQTQALEAAKTSFEQTQKRYDLGAGSFSELLQAQDMYLKNQNLLTQMQLSQAMAEVTLYRALGGGTQPQQKETP